VRGSSGWQIETVDGPAAYGWTVGYSPSIALDALEWPHISYYYMHYMWDTKYAWFDGSGWSTSIIDDQGGPGTSLALDGTGTALVSYCGVNLAVRQGEEWNIEIVDDVATYLTSLSLDALGVPHVCYSDNSEFALKHAFKEANNWQIDTIFEGNAEHYVPSLATDLQGNLHVSFIDQISKDLLYAFLPCGEVHLSGTLQDTCLLLTWSVCPGADGYWLYGAENMAWFVPGIVTPYQFRIDVLPSTVTDYESAYGLGNPESNWTYLVIAVDDAESELTRSNRVGEQDFEGDIP
jgi:hypothetical protein